MLFCFDDRGQGRDVIEAEQAGKVKLADFYDNSGAMFLNIKVNQ